MKAGSTIEPAICELTAALSGANLVHDVGFTEAANSASLEQIAATDQIIGMVGTILRRIEVSSETIALDVMEAVGAGAAISAKGTPPAVTARTGSPGCSTGVTMSNGRRPAAFRRAIEPTGVSARSCSEHRPEPLAAEVQAELDELKKNWWREID